MGMREALRSTGAIDTSRVKLIPISYILICLFKVDWHELVNRSQGDNREEMEAAQKMLDEVTELFQVAETRHQEAAAREEEARQAEAPFKAAQEELEAALADVKSQEDEYQGKIADCRKRSEEGGVVSRNKAKAELAQLEAEDPLPLRKSKITLEAARKRAEAARAPFEAATKQAEAARAAAESALSDARAKVKKQKTSSRRSRSDLVNPMVPCGGSTANCTRRRLTFPRARVDTARSKFSNDTYQNLNQYNIHVIRK